MHRAVPMRRRLADSPAAARRTTVLLALSLTLELPAHRLDALGRWLDALARRLDALQEYPPGLESVAEDQSMAAVEVLAAPEAASTGALAVAPTDRKVDLDGKGRPDIKASLAPTVSSSMGLP